MAPPETLDDVAIRAQLVRRAAGADSVDDVALRAVIALRLAGETQQGSWLSRPGALKPAMVVAAIALVVTVAVVVGGRTSGPLVGQTQKPTAVAISPSPGATPVSTPDATIPAGPLATTAAVDAYSIHVSIELERNPMPAGEPTWVTTTVTNTGTDDLIWLHGACAHPTTVFVNGTVRGQSWRPGRSQTGKGLRFKSMALAGAGVDMRAISIGFVPEAYVGVKGNQGCSDVGVTEALAAGATIWQRAQWDGAAGFLLGPPPTGRVELIGSFRFFWRRSAGEPADQMAAPAIDVSLTTWIDGRVEGIIHPAEAIDAALLDRRLLDILEARDLGNANSPVLRYDPVAAVWQVGLLDENYGGEPQVHLALVDGRTGQIVQFIERTWNFSVDGYP